jgi:hypothetical protein
MCHFAIIIIHGVMSIKLELENLMTITPRLKVIKLFKYAFHTTCITKKNGPIRTKYLFDTVF